MDSGRFWPTMDELNAAMMDVLRCPLCRTYGSVDTARLVALDVEGDQALICADCYERLVSACA